ncbi:hypothetical protein CHS0354_038620 [Potamilus streckersoni]|uniref:ZP domain-containing protein n=1 Tax=Potamilus streckersoni TaxID=2493646 RepID=A0AAE0WDJ1_9BIVA|nr:hypothetical protein CHS0354_038620 [Potamilus streckersoni]
MVKLVFVFVGIFTIIFNKATNGHDFRCFLDGRIEIIIEKNRGYVKAMARNSYGLCPIEFQSPYRMLLIQDCGFDDNITVILSSRNDTLDDVIGGKKISSFSIRCNEVNESGLLGTALFRVTPELQTTKMSILDPILEKVMCFLFTDYTMSTYADKVVIGSHIVWVLSVTRGIIYPTSCTAYEGREVDLKKPNRKIIQDGCSMDDELVGDFNNSEVNRVMASFYAFRFIHSPYITVACDVRVCPENSLKCDFLCQKGEKKKRYAELDDQTIHRENVRVSLLVEDLQSYFSSAFMFTSPVRLSTMVILLSILCFCAVY